MLLLNGMNSRSPNSPLTAPISAILAPPSPTHRAPAPNPNARPARQPTVPGPRVQAAARRVVSAAQRHRDPLGGPAPRARHRLHGDARPRALRAARRRAGPPQALLGPVLHLLPLSTQAQELLERRGEAVPG